MNKKLIAAAITAALAAPMAAQADVSVYGLGQLELQSKDAAGAGAKTTIADNKNTRVGVKWSEDLGGGMKAIGAFEWGPNLLNAASKKDSGNNTDVANGIYAREQWIGIKGGFGAIKAGIIHSAYKYAGGVKYDAFVATGIQARGQGGMLASSFGQNGYLSNSIGYYGKFGMVSFDATYSPAETSDANAVYSGSKGDLTAALTFGFNGGQAGFAYAKDAHKTGTTGVAGNTNTKIFGKYSFGTSTILGQYENSKPDGGSATKVAYLAYRLKLPSMNSLAVQVGQTKPPNSGNKTNYAAIGFRHNMSKKTSVFAGYMNSKTDGSDATKVITLGLTEKF